MTVQLSRLLSQKEILVIDLKNSYIKNKKEKPDSEVKQVIELIGKDVKTAIINILRVFKRKKESTSIWKKWKYKKEPNRTFSDQKIQYLKFKSTKNLLSLS